jgi:thiol:disulfide interchange protein DsbC
MYFSYMDIHVELKIISSVERIKWVVTMKKLASCLLMCIAVIMYSSFVFAGSDVEKSLKTDFSDLKFDSVVPSPVAGLYEVVVEQTIYYYAPKEGILIAGQMFDKTKRNLTADRAQELQAKIGQEIVRKAKDLPLDKAVKAGTGKHIVIEFTDPDCPYCRKAAEFFEKRDDVTKYTFLMPLPMHPDAKNKLRYILCQKDKGKALEEVMKGKIDNGKYETCKSAEVDDLIKIHESVAAKMGISSTPFFIINETPISGADIPKLERELWKESVEKK